MSDFKALLDHVAWKKLEKVAKGQVDNRLPGILTKLGAIEEVLSQEFEKGEVSGIQLFMQLPGISIEALEQEVDSIEEELERNGGERRTDSDSVSGDDGDASGDFEPAI